MHQADSEEQQNAERGAKHGLRSANRLKKEKKKDRENFSPVPCRPALSILPQLPVWIFRIVQYTCEPL
jgi:hypothetical protein